MSLRTGLTESFEFESSPGPLVGSVAGTTLTNVNGVTFAAGKVGNAAIFSAASAQRLAIDTTAFAGRSGDFSFCLWCYRTSNAATATLLGTANGSGAGRDYNLRSPASSLTVNWNCFDATGTSIGTAASALPAFDTWAMVYVEYEHAPAANPTVPRAGISINNAAITSVNLSGPIGTLATGFRIGCENTGNCWNGGEDMVRYYPRLMTSAERTQTYNNGDGLGYTQFPADASPIGALLAMGFFG